MHILIPPLRTAHVCTFFAYNNVCVPLQHKGDHGLGVVPYALRESGAWRKNLDHISAGISVFYCGKSYEKRAKPMILYPYGGEILTQAEFDTRPV